MKKFQISNFKFQTQNGFTLVEMTVTLFAFAILVLGLVELYGKIFTDTGRQTAALANADQSRKMAFGIINELRNAQTANTGAYALAAADDQQLVMYANIDTDSFVEKIRYFVQNGKLYKGITKYDGVAYPAGGEQIGVVQDSLANGNIPVFSYYDGSFYGGSAQSALGQPVSPTAVKFVKVSLMVYNKAGSGQSVYVAVASGAIRNLKTNLGQ